MAVFWAWNPSILAAGAKTDFNQMFPTQSGGTGSIVSLDSEKGIQGLVDFKRTTDITTYPAANWASGWTVFRWRITSIAAERQVFRVRTSGGGEHFSINANTSGSFDIVNGAGSDVATAQGAFSIDTWYTIAVEWTINNTTGILKFWVDGALVYNGSGLDTQSGGTADGHNLWYGVNVSTVVIGWIIAGDTTGSIATAFDNTKNYQVSVLLPDGAGNSTQWTPSTGSNYDTVNEAEYSETDYNSSNTNTHKDTFAMGALPGTADEVFAVVPFANADMDDATARQLNTVVRHSSSEAASADRSLSNGNTRHVHGASETNPSTAAQWSVAEVNAMEVGYELSM